MFCIHCGANNPDDANFCQKCGTRQPGQALPNQPIEAVAQSEHPQPGQALPYQPVETPAQVSSPEQQSYTEQATPWHEPVTPEPALPIYGNQLWEEFGTANSSPDQQPLPQNQMPSDMPWALEPELDRSAANKITRPLPPLHTPWTRVLEPRFGALARPAPIWVALIAIVVVAAGILVLQLTGSDWANGALHAAITAGIIGIVVVLATGVRFIAGMRGRGRFIFAGVNIVLLIALCLTGLTQQSFIHRLQGNNLEGQKQWQRAITEYQLGGEGVPTSVDIARTYVEWGEQLSAAQQYTAANAKFDIVMQNYASATSEVTRAQSDELAADFAIAKQDTQGQNYVAATTLYDLLLQLPYCNSDCHTQASALDATAYYSLAESQLTAQQYDSAVTTFQTLLTRFPNSPEAQKIHPDLASALLGQGQLQLASDCTSAIPTYQELSTQYADTPAGQKAIQALQAPQPVTGQFIGLVLTDPTLIPIAILAKNLRGNMTSAQFQQALTGAPTVNVQSDGSFSFKPLPQGNYDLAWGTVRSNGTGVVTFTYNVTTNDPAHIATVGPLCPFSFGPIYEVFPTAP